MMHSKAYIKTASVMALALAVGLSGCSTISRLNPLNKGDEGPEAVATQGERISIVAFDQKMAPSESLAGIDFYVPEPKTVSSWPKAGGPDGVEIDHVDAAKDFKVAWTKSIGEKSKGLSQVLAPPVSDGKLIYVMDGNAHVSAFDVNSGERVWEQNLNPDIKRDKDAFGGGLALNGDKLFVTSGYRLVIALNAQTGAREWEKTLDSPAHAAPIYNAKYVFVTDVDNQLMAFDVATGDPMWTYQAIVEPARILKSSSPVIGGNVLYAPFSSGELIALDTNTGSPVWQQVLARTSRTNALSEIRDISGHPVIYRNEVFAASHSGVFAAMDLKTGQPRWTVNADSINTPLPAGDVVYLATVQGELMAVNRDSGQVYWLADLNEGEPKTKKSFFGLGKEKKIGVRTVWTGPVLASGRLILVNSDGKAVAFDPKTGKKTDELKIEGAAFIAPIPVGDKLFVVTNDAKLVAIQ